MDELLTVNQVKDLLKVDRLTVYRMLKDGRLNGVKIGHEWRFARTDLDSLLSGKLSVQPAVPVEVESPLLVSASIDDLPVHCVQLMQDVFAGIAEVAGMTLTPAGEP